MKNMVKLFEFVRVLLNSYILNKTGSNKEKELEGVHIPQGEAI